MPDDRARRPGPLIIHKPRAGHFHYSSVAHDTVYPFVVCAQCSRPKAVASEAPEEDAGEGHQLCRCGPLFPNRPSRPTSPAPGTGPCVPHPASQTGFQSSAVPD